VIEICPSHPLPGLEGFTMTALSGRAEARKRPEPLKYAPSALEFRLPGSSL